MLRDNINATAARDNFKSTCDTVCENNAPVLVKRKGAEDVVIISASDFGGMEETIHLLSSRIMATRLMRSMKQLDEGKGVQHDIIEE
ncbi:Antitoxin YefM (plasmid) [Piscirickettsia salmonis]|uniref:type II toxin-antitoxin system Phd/YefM family antitoxin n=1 Tax=Piscirickettsia salmonis TaxID=1238 RepID=UPI000F088050|nr:type II toxin-antitoxin system Phd/YefM family antitoxin [Piscirickettsia salmonis]QGP52074.1 Antitoxin YefM [Piscirickettsia salmonis]RNC76802.1 prevent-host-death protein [Piscirickettsiaceae bacterium NZ-RLO2]